MVNFQIVPTTPHGFCIKNRDLGESAHFCQKVLTFELQKKRRNVQDFCTATPISFLWNLGSETHFFPPPKVGGKK